MKKLLLYLAAAAVSSAAFAKVQLTPLFSDNMVLQQNCQAPVWGKAAPGAEVSVVASWNKKPYRATADASGNWSVSIDTPKGSFKKYSLIISDGEPVELRNVLVGEVWLASGQSNMQMPVESWRAVRTNQEDILGASQYADLRLLQVSRATGMAEHDYFSADFDGWTESSPKTVRNFSAIAWYFGRRLMQELKVPVGLIHSSWGGTVIEAWMSAGALRQYPEMLPGLEKVRALSDSEAERARTFEQEINAFYEKVTRQDTGLNGGVASWAAPSFDDSAWKSLNLPCKVQKLWPSTNGIYWFRKTVLIPSSWAGRDLTLSLGPVDDFDETYWNGEQVGSGRLWNMAREYRIPARMVKEGRAVICIRNTDDHGDGGLYGAPDLLYLEGPDGKRIPLDNEWKVKLSVSFEGMPKSTAREPNMTSVLYNAMIRPLAPFAIKGAIWYQGEANTPKAYRYRELMRSLILDWRSLWGSDFPFYITQLANYNPVLQAPSESDWAELREAQEIAARTTVKTGLACIIDIGEAEDIHPVRKRQAAERLALQALAKDYGKKLQCDGPVFESYVIAQGQVRIRFSNIAGGLKVQPSGDFAAERYGRGALSSELVKKAESGELCGFQIAGADHVWHWADARIEGGEAVVSSPEVPQPVAVRYAWADNPVCNLYNSENLPARPFRTDDWPGISYGKL